MKTILLLLILLTTSVSVLLAQVPANGTDNLINRPDKQSEHRWKHEVSTSKRLPASSIGAMVLFDKDRQLPASSVQSQSFSITFPSQTIDFTSGTTGNIKGHMVNNTDSTLHLVFRRWQTLPSDQWNSSVCFGDLCYIYFVDSLPWGDNLYYEFLPKAEADFKLVVYAPSGANDSMSAYVNVSAINTVAGDSMGFYLVGKAAPKQSVGTTNSKGNFKIQSVYPSPLVSGSSLKVKLTAPDNAGYSYTIFDNLGREVAFGSTRQQLMIGENTVEISSLDGLLTGSYLLRIKFNGGGSDAIPFQVIR